MLGCQCRLKHTDRKFLHRKLAKRLDESDRFFMRDSVAARIPSCLDVEFLEHLHRDSQVGFLQDVERLLGFFRSALLLAIA